MPIERKSVTVNAPSQRGSRDASRDATGDSIHSSSAITKRLLMEMHWYGVFQREDTMREIRSIILRDGSIKSAIF